MKLFTKLPLALLVILIGSCTSAKRVSATTDDPLLKGDALLKKEWKLTELNGKPVESSTAGLNFTSDKGNMVSGSTGCNRVTGSYVLSGTDGLQFGPLATTRMACLDEKVSALERDFLAALGQVNKWTVADNRLSLKNGDEVLASFLVSDTGISKIQEKLNGNWELSFIAAPQASFDSLYHERKPTITFKFPDTVANGNSSCNGYSANFQVDNYKIRFGDVISTMMACGGDGEKIFFETLKKITSFDFPDDHTLVFISGDIVEMKFEKK